MNHNLPKLSIIIPTRNRQDYLLYAVNTIVQYCPSAEIIVCDNSSSDKLRDILAAHISGGNIRYSYSSEYLSVVDNFERALKMSTGKYVMFIGDDDSVGPGLQEVVDWAIEFNVDAVVSYRDKFLVSYFWPGVQSKYYGNGYAANMFVHDFSGEAFKIDPIESLRSVADVCGSSGLGSLPRAYHGLVARSVLDRVTLKHGRVFGGVSPDIYSATLIASECSSAYVVDFPFVIPGASSVSTAGQGAAQSDRTSLRNTEHTARFGDGLIWDELIPEFYSPHTVWAFSLKKALDCAPGLGIAPSYARLYARCLLYNSAYKTEISAAIESWKTIHMVERFRLVIGWAGAKEIWSQIRRIGRRAISPRAGGNAVKFSQLQTIFDAYETLSEHIRVRGVHLSLPKLETVKRSTIGIPPLQN